MSILDELLYRVTELERQLANAVQIGTVEEVDYSEAKCRVQIGELLTGWISWTADRASDDSSWEPLHKGEQVVVACQCGDPALGVVIGRLYRTAHPAPSNNPDVTRRQFGDGLVIEHDRKKKLTKISALDSDGTLVLEAKNMIRRTGENGYDHLDNYGKASRLTHTGGNTFKSETWNDVTDITPVPDHGYEADGKVLTPEEA